MGVSKSLVKIIFIAKDLTNEHNDTGIICIIRINKLLRARLIKIDITRSSSPTTVVLN